MSNLALAQTSSVSDAKSIYQVIFDHILTGEQKYIIPHKYMVMPKTSKSVIEWINFKSEISPTNSKREQAIWLNPEWRSFISHIDTSKIEEFYLRTGKKEWFKSSGRGPVRTVWFSPVMLSPDVSKALCFAEVYNKLAGGNKILYYFQKVKGRWDIVLTSTLAIYD